MFLAIYTDLEMFKGLDGFLKGLMVSLIAILIVFLILFVICLLVTLLKVIGKKALAKEKSNEVVSETVSENKKTISASDIKDDDMMAAVLVATIDFVSENKQDARVVSVKQIG